MVRVVPPGIDDFFGFIQASEPVLVQALFSEAAIETFNKGILCWFARLIIKASLTPDDFCQKNIALLVNSVPLSQVIWSGALRLSISWSRNRPTIAPVIEKATS